MIRLCESCFQRIVADEPHVVLRSLYKVGADSYPEWRELYLHHYDAKSRGCTVTSRSDAVGR
jgi:hypothetical protein